MIQMSKTKDHLARHTAFRFLAKHSWVDSAQPILMIHHQLFQKKQNVAELNLETKVEKNLDLPVDRRYTRYILLVTYTIS